MSSFEGQGGVNGWTLVCNGGRTGALLQVLSKCATRRCCSSAQVMATLGFLFELWDQILEGFSSTADEGQLRGRARGMKVTPSLTPNDAH